jgi:hypothetical protein
VVLHLRIDSPDIVVASNIVDDVFHGGHGRSVTRCPKRSHFDVRSLWLTRFSEEGAENQDMVKEVSNALGT